MTLFCPGASNGACAGLLNVTLTFCTILRIIVSACIPVYSLVTTMPTSRPVVSSPKIVGLPAVNVNGNKTALPAAFI